MTLEERLDAALSAVISQDVSYRRALLDMLRAVVAEETEACAKIAERWGRVGVAPRIAAAIRAHDVVPGDASRAGKGETR